MSPRKAEFERRASIFEGAFRAWSRLGGLEPTDLETKISFELDPLNFPIRNDVGRAHSFVQAILSLWLGPDADKDAVQLGLVTLRMWWLHRRKGQSGSAVAALGTERMREAVEGHARHFCNLAHCLVVNNAEQPPTTLQGNRTPQWAAAPADPEEVYETAATAILRGLPFKAACSETKKSANDSTANTLASEAVAATNILRGVPFKAACSEMKKSANASPVNPSTAVSVGGTSVLDSIDTGGFSSGVAPSSWSNSRQSVATKSARLACGVVGRDFPTKVLVMLEIDKAIFSWLPHGRAVKVHDEQCFLRDMAPMFFKVSKFRSFTRQLHLWGFRRISSGVDIDGWWNPHFLRGRPELMSQMVRIKVKGMEKGKKIILRAPDFYAMPSPDSESECMVTTPQYAPSLPVAHADKNYESMTPLNQRQGKLDDHLQGGSGPRIVSTNTINLVPDIIPFVPPLGYGRQTETHAQREQQKTFEGIVGAVNFSFEATVPSGISSSSSELSSAANSDKTAVSESHFREEDDEMNDKKNDCNKAASGGDSSNKSTGGSVDTSCSKAEVDKSGAVDVVHETAAAARPFEAYDQSHTTDGREPVAETEDCKADDEEEEEWYYIDLTVNVQGPFSRQQMREWWVSGYLTADLPICPNKDGDFIYLKSVFSVVENAFDRDSISRGRKS